jgi:hypothetical protein
VSGPTRIGSMQTFYNTTNPCDCATASETVQFSMTFGNNQAEYYSEVPRTCGGLFVCPFYSCTVCGQ